MPSNPIFRYTAEMTMEEIEAYIRLIPGFRVFIWPFHKFYSADKFDNTIVLRGVLTSANMEIIEQDDTLYISIKFRNSLRNKILLIIYLVFASLILFIDKVTINGNPDPSMMERIGFFLIMVLIAIIALFINRGAKQDFLKLIIDEFKLTPIDESSE